MINIYPHTPKTNMFWLTDLRSTIIKVRSDKRSSHIWDVHVLVDFRNIPTNAQGAVLLTVCKIYSYAKQIKSSFYSKTPIKKVKN